MLFLITVGFNNFNLRIFNLRISNPSKLIVDVFCHDVGFQCASHSAQKKHDEIQEIDRMGLTALYTCVAVIAEIM